VALDVGPARVRSEINVAPLVDVVLVLLIIFMVVTPMLQRGRPVRLPEAEAVQDLGPGGDPIVVSVTADRRIFLEGAEVGRERLAAALGDERTRRPGARVLLKGDRSLEYRTVRTVVREIARTGVSGFSLAATEIRGRR
jgi:biopolymer transport protein TolR